MPHQPILGDNALPPRHEWVLQRTPKPDQQTPTSEDFGFGNDARRRDLEIEGVLVQRSGTIRQQRSGIERGLAKEFDTRRDDGHHGANIESFHRADLEGTGV